MTETIDGELTEAQHQQTVEEHLQDLLQWLNSRNLAIVPVAIGLRHGTASNISEYLPTSHIADWSLQEQPK